jgi:hypothetical protein
MRSTLLRSSAPLSEKGVAAMMKTPFALFVEQGHQRIPPLDFPRVRFIRHAAHSDEQTIERADMPRIGAAGRASTVIAGRKNSTVARSNARLPCGRSSLTEIASTG